MDGELSKFWIVKATEGAAESPEEVLLARATFLWNFAGLRLCRARSEKVASIFWRACGEQAASLEIVVAFDEVVIRWHGTDPIESSLLQVN